MATTYRIIGFGDYEHGFFNQPRFSSNEHEALLDYSEFVEDPEMDGAVLIKVDHETWEVVRQFSDYPISIVYGPLGNFKVEKSPELVMV